MIGLYSENHRVAKTTRGSSDNVGVSYTIYMV